MIALIRVFSKNVLRRALQKRLSLKQACDIEVNKLNTHLGTESSAIECKETYNAVIKRLEKGVYVSRLYSSTTCTLPECTVAIDAKGLACVTVEKAWLLPWAPVRSSMVQGIEVKSGNLHVTFNTGKEAKYIEAGQHYYPILRADSVGKYFNENIRGLYPWSYVK